MKTHAQAVVIGGGVIGCSILYHLAKLGWTDVVLLERDELTSGSTWHAAANIHGLHDSTNISRIQHYTMRLYNALEAETGQSCGVFQPGSLYLAQTEAREHQLRLQAAKARLYGMNFHEITRDEAERLHPLVDFDGIRCIMWEPDGGNVDPSGVTNAYAVGARAMGAEIHRFTPVTATRPQPDGTWIVETPKGEICTDWVINAAGLWAREVGAMAGVYLPLHPMEHQYVVTDEVPEIVARDTEHPHVMDPAGESYLRQEGRGLCIGFYEQPCKPWAVDGTPWDFGHELLPDNLDKIEASIEFAYRRFPALERAGVKSVIHGPFTFAPDGNPLVGPVPGLRNYWSACGVMAGFSQGGGVGLMLAQWMIEGECERDVTAMDVARFGDWITPGYTRPKVIENYQTRFSVSYPNEELPAARPFRQTPMYDIFDGMGAVWGQQFGLEVVNYFAAGDEPRVETPSFRRSNAFDATAREVAAVRNAVGINETHNFGKYMVTGPGARAWLDRIMAGRLPRPGRLALSPMLSPKGRLLGDFTVSCLGDEAFQLTASYGAQAVHMRWFQRHEAEGVRVENVSDRLTGFQIAGPRAREVLTACTRDAIGGMAFMDVRRATLGMVDCLVQRVSYTGDLGYEIFCDPMAQRALWDVLWRAGQPHGMRPFGMRAMMSLRLDRFFGSWMAEYSPDYTPGETGMDRFIAWDKEADFIGRAAVEAERQAGAARRLVAFEVEAEDADVHGYEPIWIDGRVQGFCTSGGYAHHAGKSVALGLVPADLADGALEAEIEILGQMRPARRLTAPLFDADGARMRG